MANPYISRKPWAAALIALVFGPLAGMCYVNRGRTALLYLAAFILFYLLVFLALVTGLIIHVFHAVAVVIGFSLFLQIAGSVHSYKAARKYSGEPLHHYARWYGVVAVVLAPMLFASLFKCCLYEAFHFSSDSMSPTVNSGDYIFAKKFSYWTQSPQRGDVIVFRNNNVNFITRIVGLPGDKVQLKANVLYINDAPIPQVKLENYSFYGLKGDRTVSQYSERLPGSGGEYHILTGYPSEGMDTTAIYDVPSGSYFVLGDNRDDSIDSRFPGKIGFVPRANILGKAVYVIFNFTNDVYNPRPVQ